VSDWRSRLSDEERGALTRASPPDWISPMLATLTDDRFSDADWIFERKLDGERLLAFRHGKKVRLLTRNQKSAADTYPEIIDALADQRGADFVVDGELVAFDGNLSSFARLQQRMKITDAEKARASDVRVYFYVFDLPWFDGCVLDELPLRTRKGILRREFDFGGPVRYTPHRNRDGEQLFHHACDRGWEGIIAKRADSRYRHSRSRDWLKFKCDKGQELVIGGFTEPRGTRTGFGALLVGYHDEQGELRYAGRVGTGYDEAFLADFRQQLDDIAIDEAPFVDPPSRKRTTWVEPKFVGEFGFTEWTREGKLRHPRFLGLRRDKQAGEIEREAADG
jgi:bifunctional non-homologous end joining protein LigD